MVEVSDWPAGAQSSITVNYQQGATPPPANARITVTLILLAHQLSSATLQLARAAASAPLRKMALRGDTDFAPSEVCVIGAMTYRFGP
jgi:hypothetical protein